MTQTIRIPKPSPPIPLLPRTARKWVPRDQWCKKDSECATEPSVPEMEDIHASTEAFERFIRRILFWREVQ